MNFQERLTAFAMLGAGWVMWFLLILSIVGLAVVLERCYFLVASRDNIRTLYDDVLRLFLARDLEGAKARLSKSRSFEARIVFAGLDVADQGAAAAEERMEAEALLSKLQMERNLAFLGTVGNNAPFVGLLGTVIGVIRSFQALDGSEGRVTQGLMSEIGEALVATAIGIMVALPAVAFFNLFMRIVKARLARADSLGRRLLAVLRATRTAGGSDQDSVRPEGA